MKNIIALLFILFFLPSFAFANEDVLLGPYDEIGGVYVLDGNLYYSYKLGEDYYAVINNRIFGPYENVRMHWGIGVNYFEYKRDNHLFILYNDKVYGPYDEIIETSNDERGINILHKNNSNFFIENESNVIGPLKSIDTNLGIVSLFSGLNEKWWLMDYSNDSIYVNDKKYGPFDGIKKVLQKDEQWIFQYLTKDGYGFYKNGKNYGPYSWGLSENERREISRKNISRSYDQPVLMGLDEYGWWLLGNRSNPNFNGDKKEYFLVVDGTERGPYQSYEEALYNIYFDMDIRKEVGGYKVFDQGVEYGPFEEVYNYSCAPLGQERQLANLPHSFCVKSGDEESCMVGAKKYGPFDEVVIPDYRTLGSECMKMFESSDYKQWGFIGRNDENYYAVINGDKYGPYDDVRSIVFADDSWSFGYKESGKYFLMYDNVSYELEIDLDDVIGYRNGIFYPKDKFDYSPGQCHTNCTYAGSEVQEIKDSKVYLKYKKKGNLEEFVNGKQVMRSQSETFQPDYTTMEKDGFKYLKISKSSPYYQEGKEAVIEPKHVKNKQMYNRLKGRILLKTEDSGRAYYVHPGLENIYFLGRPNDAFQVMRSQGVGISDVNLSRIANKDENFSSDDNRRFAERNAGKIFLQVEQNGEAWYINPNDLKKYYLGRPMDAFRVMRELGLGISNDDFDSL